MKKQISLASLITLLITSNLVSAEPSVRLSETIVSTKGFEATAQNENKNALVVDSKDIESKGYNDISDVLSSSPYFATNNAGMSSIGKKIDIRGQGLAATKNVKVIIGGIPMQLLDMGHDQPFYNSIAPSDIERIEVLPGSNAVLYGSGTAGGVVNIITKADLQKEFMNIEASYKSFNTKNLSAGMGTKLNDKLYFSINMDKGQGNGYRDGEYFENNSFGTSLAYNITDNQNISVSFRTFDTEGMTSPGITKEQMEQDRKSKGAWVEDYLYNVTSLIAKYNLKINDNMSVKASAFYSMSNSLSPLSGKSGNYDINMSYKDEIKGVDVSQQLNYLNNQGSFILGYNFLNDHLNYSTVGVLADLTKTTNSVYAMNKYTIAEALGINIGYRFENARYNNIRKTQTGLGGSQNNSAYNLGLNYEISDTNNVYFNYERGFTTPTSVELNNSTSSKPSQYKFNNLKAETGDNFELGYKGYAVGTYITLNGFYTLKNNEIVTLASPHTGLTTEYGNIDKTERLGMELFLEQSFGPLSLAESFTYIKADILEGNNKGEKVALVPDMKATVSANYEVIKGLKLGTDLVYTGKYLSANGSKGEDMDAVFVTNIRASYNAVDNFYINAGVNNLFGAEYIEAIDLSGLYIVAPKQTYYVGLQYKF